MKDRGKAVEAYRGGDGGGDGFFADNYYSSSSENPCRKHPGASSVGVCAHCLKDRLARLVCSECGEQRLSSSCSCSSDISSNRNSCTVEVGSVGRISFLLESDKSELLLSRQISTSSKPRVGGAEYSNNKAEEAMVFKRSSSSCVEMKRVHGIWRIGKLFRKKKDRKKSVVDNGFDAKSEMWVVDHQSGVSRSRSLSSFRGGKNNGYGYGSEDGGDHWTFSGARSSISGARTSSVNGGLLLDPERKSCFSEAEFRRSGFSESETIRRSCFSEAEPRRSGFSEAEPRKSGFDGGERKEPLDHHHVTPSLDPIGNKPPTRRIFSLKEGDFTGGDDTGFIDLKFFSTEARQDPKMGALGNSRSAFGSIRGGGGDGGVTALGGDFRSGSCRVTVSEKEVKVKQGRRSFMGWRWGFGHHQHHPNWMMAAVLCKE
ncbi:hypothetical protein BT93_C2101 [Corymbia citriodora subsp. variegata]|nr:hypothetical protein BT93_C2101 [Corymbia citriodora subsp. variegata]